MPRRRGPVARGASAPDAGMVTAEAAVVLPLLLLVTVLAITAVALGAARVRCLEAAGLAARLAARGESPAAVDAAVRAAAPHGVRLRVGTDGALTEAVVVLPVRVALLGIAVPALTISESAFAMTESPADPPHAGSDP
jgi:hypothetical protein